MTDKAPTITVETAVAAPADTVCGLITDLDTMAQFGEEVTAMKVGQGQCRDGGQCVPRQQPKRLASVDHHLHR